MIIIKCFGLKCKVISKYINDSLLYVVQYIMYYIYQSVYVFVQHSVDEISLGQTVALFLKLETMHSFPEAMVQILLQHFLWTTTL